MERSSVEKEEKVSERTTTLCHHLCYFLEEALRALLKCLGVETALTKKQEKTSHLKPHSDADLDLVTTPETSATNVKKSSHEGANPPSATTQNIKVYDIFSLYYLSLKYN